MKALCRTLLVTAVVALVAAPAALAQPDKPWKEWFPHLAVQYSVPQGDAGDVLDDGWGLAGGVIYKPENWSIGIPIELGVSRMDVDQGIVDMLVVDEDGDPVGARADTTIWNLTGGVQWQTQTQGRTDFYVNANIGIYRREIELRVPAGVAWRPGFCSPYWYWCVPGGFVPVDAVDSDTQTRVGGNIGVGVAFSLNNDSQIYIEAKYQYMDSSDVSTEWVPIQVGYRW